MKETARQARTESCIIGLVPTMGALHAGHLSLVARARQDCEPVFASIFVNPKQFGPKEDLAKYPRMLEKDSQQLAVAGVRGLFLPEAAEMYPSGFSTYVNVEGLSDRLEGRTRPGHFRGVTTVVLKLLESSHPLLPTSPQGRTAGAPDHPDGARLEPRHANCSGDHHPRKRRLSHVLAKCLFDSAGTRGCGGSASRAGVDQRGFATWNARHHGIAEHAAPHPRQRTPRQSRLRGNRRCRILRAGRSH